MSIRRTRLALVSCLTAVAAAVTGLTLNSTANATTPAPTAITSVALTSEEAVPPLAMEDLNYPNAASIQQTKGILLKRGDGNIVLVACDGTSDIVVKNRVSPSTEFCFDVRAKPGYLALELNDTFGIRTHDYPVTATVTANGQKSVFNIAIDDYKAIGEGDAGGPRSALVELRVTE